MTDLPKEDRDLTYEQAEQLALRAIHDSDGRGMIGRGRNHLHQRVARAILAVRSEGPARAPVVDDGVLSRMRELAANERCHWGAHAEPAVDVRVSDLKALLAALGASQ